MLVLLYSWHFCRKTYYIINCIKNRTTLFNKTEICIYRHINNASTASLGNSNEYKLTPSQCLSNSTLCPSLFSFSELSSCRGRYFYINTTLSSLPVSRQIHVWLRKKIRYYIFVHLRHKMLTGIFSAILYFQQFFLVLALAQCSKTMQI